MQRLRRQPDDAREISAGIDDRVPVAGREQIQLCFAVAADLVHVREQVRIRLPAIEEGQVVPARTRGIHQVPSEEARAADDQYFHDVLILDRCVSPDTAHVRAEERSGVILSEITS